MNNNTLLPENPEDAMALCRRYPYFIYPLVATIDKTEGRQRQLFCRRITAAVDSELALRNIFKLDAEDLQRFYPPLTPESMTTDDTINSFLDKFSNRPDEKIPEEIPIAPPAADYTAALEQEMPEAEVADETSDIINSFLNANPTPKTQHKPLKAKKIELTTSENEIPANNDTATLTESFAGIMIKNGNYEKALEIITKLSLNNPKKNIYFADQIRFLKKLILNKSKS